MFKIGEFSKLTMVSVKMLRHYDKLNLLSPSFIDDFTGYRYYSASKMVVLNRILSLKEMGFALKEIKNIIDSNLSENQFKSLLSEKKDQISESIRNENEKISKINFYLKAKNLEEIIMNYNVTFENVPELIVASRRLKLDSYESQGKVWLEMGKYMEEQGSKLSNPVYCYTLYYDKEYKEKDIDMEICESVTEMKPSSDKFIYKKVPAVDNLATVVHKGPFSTLKNGYSAILKWLEENSYKIVGEFRETYFKGPWDTEDENDYVTKIQVPVEKING